MATRNQQLLDAQAAALNLSKTLKDIYFAWPNLQQCTLKLIDFMGKTIVTHDGTFLLSQCLLDAVAAYEAVDPFHIGRPEQMMAYLAGLIKSTPRIAECSLVGNSGKQDIWDPFSKNIFEFISDENSTTELHEFKAYEVTTATLQVMVLARIISIRDMQWLDEAGGLDKVVSRIN